jgi:hypothetical protein
VFLLVELRTTHVLQVLTHVLPPVFATIAVVRSGLEQGAGLLAWFMFAIVFWLGKWFTDPALNVNLAHRPSGLLARFVPNRGWARVAVLTLAFVTLQLADALLMALLGRSV